LSLVLVDSSVWVDYFRKASSLSGKALRPLLEDGRVCTTPIIVTELLSGSPSEREYDRLRVLLGSLPLLKVPADLWDRTAWTRFRLARTGVQAQLIDISIAVMAHTTRTPLFTIDAVFPPIQKVLTFSLFAS